MFGTTEIFAVLAVAIFVGAANGLPPQRIVGGSIADPNEFPYQVSLRFQGMHFCGGTIVSSRHIITAGHCVKSMTPFILKIATGTISNDGGEIHSVSKIVPHPQYNRTTPGSLSDIAIITLTDDINFNENQTKIDLPNAPTPVGVTAITSGWGMQNFSVHVLAPKLMKLEMITISLSTCKRILGSRIYDNQICTFAGIGLGGCNGDSGGPLVYDGKLIGVSSWTVDCATGWPDVFTSIFHHLEWIEQTMKD